MNDSQIVAKQTDFPHDVSGEYHGFSIFFAIFDELDNTPRCYHVETDCWFVEYYHIWIVNNGAGYRDLLLHAGGELRDPSVFEFIDSQ